MDLGLNSGEFLSLQELEIWIKEEARVVVQRIFRVQSWPHMPVEEEGLPEMEVGLPGVVVRRRVR